MKNIILILITFFTLSFLLGCGRIVNPIAEGKIAKTLNSHIKAEKWTCKMIGDPNLSKMSAPDVTITGNNVSYNDANIEQVVLHFKNIQFNMSDKTIKSCENASADIKIKDKEVTNLIKHHIKYVKNPEIIAQDNLLIIKGETDFLGQTITVEIKGILKVQNGIEIIIEPDSLKIMNMGINIPENAKNIINKKINPIYVIKNNPYGIYINNINFKEGYFIINADFDSVNIMKALKEK